MKQDAPDETTPLTPQQEVEALRRGGIDALQAFYATYAPTVLAWAIRLGGPRLDTNDLTRRAFARALRRIHRANSAMGLAGWLFTNLQVELRRARRRAFFRRLVGLGHRPPRAQGPGEAVVLKRRSRVQDALARLPVATREVVVLVELEGRTVNQAAALLGVTPHAVLGRLAASRDRVRRALERAGIEDLRPQGAGRVLQMPRRKP